MKKVKSICGLLFGSLALSLLPAPARAMRTMALRSANLLYVQESGAGEPLGKPYVSPEVMAGQCIAKVSPSYPQPASDSQAASAVVVRVVIWRSGKVSPIHVISGRPSLQAEAMNTVRLWRYKPFVSNDEPVDVTTDIRVDFEPGKPGGMVSHPNH